MKKFLFIATLMILPTASLAWDGYDYANGSFIEIEKGNLVRSGEEIEIFDWGSGEYRNVEVTDINRIGSSVELEVTDSETGEARTFEMD